LEHFKIYLRDRITDFNVYITSLPIRYYVSAKNRLYLINHKANARLSKTCELDENKVFLNTGISLFSSLLTRDSEPILTRDGVEIEVNYRRQDGVLRTIFDKCRFLLQLESINSKIHSNKIVYDIGNDLTIKNSIASTLFVLMASAQHRMSMKTGIGTISDLLTRNGIPIFTHDGTGFVNQLLSRDGILICDQSGRVLIANEQYNTGVFDEGITINHKRNDGTLKTSYGAFKHKVVNKTGIGLFSSLLTRDSEPILTRDGVEIEVNYRRQDGDTHAVKLAGFMYNTYMKHSVNPISERMADPYNNAIKISSTIGNAYLSKYRTLAEMDSDDGVSLTLSHFDDMTLEDIDYIII